MRDLKPQLCYKSNKTLYYVHSSNKLYSYVHTFYVIKTIVDGITRKNKHYHGPSQNISSYFFG